MTTTVCIPHDMNGEVMDETIEPSQGSENALSEHVQLSGEERVAEKKRQNLSDSKEERAHDPEPSTPCEMDKKGVQTEGKPLSTAPFIENRKECPLRDICDGDVENTEVPIHVKALEGLLQEGISQAPSITTNGLDKNGDDTHLNDVKQSPDPCPEKINNNSKDSSVLSTTDTQDEIDPIDNGGQIFINNIHNETEDGDSSKQAGDWCHQSEDSLEEMLGSDLDPHTEETFSTVSGSECDEASQGSGVVKRNDIVMVNDGPRKQNGNTVKPKVHEIKSDDEENEDCVVTADDNCEGTEDDDCVLTADSACVDIVDDDSEGTPDDDCVVTPDDDCVVTTDYKCVVTAGNRKTIPKTVAEKTELRRSSRTVKRKKYSYDIDDVDDESDVEEITSDDPVRRKSRPIMINDTKSLVEIAAKQAARSTSAQRREPQLVLIGANPVAKTAPSPSNKSCSSSMNESLYQSIVARGTSVTPVQSKANTATQACQTALTPPPPPPLILPSLTDDMYVVEAPSFIVPYVYEKPSIEPFKEFVDKLGKELDAQKEQAEKELREKKKKEKEKRHQERQELGDREEAVEESDEEAKPEAEEIKKRKLEKKELRRQKEEDDESWDGSDSTDSEDFKLTNEDGTTIVINDSMEEVKKDLEMFPASTSSSKTDNYFDCFLGKFFMNIGMSLVQEYVQTDLLKQQQRKLQREKKSGHSTREREVSICLLKKNLELSKENNKPYTCPQLKCEHCSFKTESALVLAQHLETPHMKNNLYKCNFCSFEIRSPHDILFHMEAEHNIRGKLERAPAYHQCANCPFEDNGKGKLARHLIACAKKFKPDHNLSPPLEWEPPAKIPKVAKARHTMMGSPYPSSVGLGRPQFGSNIVRAPGGIIGGFRPRTGRLGSPSLPAPRPVQAGGSIVRGSSMLRQNILANYPVINAKKSVQQPSISITPLPRQPAPPTLHVQAGQNTKGGNFVICEICDGYIKDLDQLRNHMQWIHKVKIHPKMIYNRPPLNCQKCQFRFFTDQGLERHLLGSHGLVTSSMQEAANKSKDAGRCPVCGKVYQWKLLNHVARDHNLTLKPAHLSYKCTVCTATFGMYKLFENHVYSAHSVVAKRVMDKNVPVDKTNIKNTNAPKGLKINDEITITAQPVKAAASGNKRK